eukprot:CAMPEP_0203691026 /NCGR_PEP_ID=MMETSP0091-20130426/3357_1 /ASSEMBLY_ACC=CAM_ASM_001089 /TAXON_ID=426623 /ORGANISM="Chaetoceros affinis, Strain CCMP159" /LENGTH=403 /DNA_ID=CAMNT_0050561379 /DNA_START=72 /DNA_END=1283 /DNA_ORIENTATION=+
MMHSPYNNQASPMPQVFVYQVEFNAIATGKIIAMSKRQIRWRYGFPNQEAIDAGKSGTECRGEEHEVTLVWSVSSGKRMIMSNGKQLFIGMNKSNTIENQWIDTRGNDIRLIAHMTPPVNSPLGSRQYELLINGKSFFSLPKSYEIGLKGPSDTRVPGNITTVSHHNASIQSPQRHPITYSDSGRTLRAPRSQEEEMDDLKRAIEESLKESKQHLARKGLLEKEEEEESATPSSTKTPLTPQEVQPSPKSEELLIDFFSDPIPSTVNPTPTQTQDALALLHPAPQQYQDPFGYNTQPVQPTKTPEDEFTPKAPTYNDISNQILLNYSAQQPQQYPSPNQTSPVASVNPFDEPSVTSDLSSLHTQQQNTNSSTLFTPTQQYQPTNSQQMPQQQQQQDFGYSYKM